MFFLVAGYFVALATFRLVLLSAVGRGRVRDSSGAYDANVAGDVRER